MTNIPSVDLADFLSNDPVRKEKFVQEIGDAYSEIGSIYGFGHQQAFLGFESFILEPDDINNDANTTYFSNLANGTFSHDYSYASTGYNGKITFNMAAQYDENLYLGLNLNSHFIDYQRSTLLFEDNSNAGSIISSIDFEKDEFKVAKLLYGITNEKAKENIIYLKNSI